VIGFGFDSISGPPSLHVKHLIYSNTNPLNLEGVKPLSEILQSHKQEETRV